MGKKPRDKAPSTSPIDGVLLHRSLMGIGAIEIAGKDKTLRDKAPFTALMEGGLFHRSRRESGPAHLRERNRRIRKVEKVVA